MVTTKKRIARKKAIAKKVAPKKPATKSVVKRAAAAPRAKPKRLEDIADIDSLEIETGDNDAQKSVKKIRKDVSARKPQVKTRGPGGVTRSAVDRIDDPPPASGVVLIERVLDSIERELVAIDKVTGDGHVNAKQRTEAERRARTLASLAKTLGEVTRLRGLHDKKARPADDTAVPRDLDEFRRELARRLDGLSIGHQDIPAEGDVLGGNGVVREAVGDLCAPASEAT